VRANARLAATYTVGSAAGPAAAGALIDAFGAPFVVLADAISFLVSAAALSAIRAREIVAPDGAGRGNLLQGMRDGWICVWRTVVLRVIAVTNSGFFFAYGIMTGISAVFQVRVLGLSPLEIGIIAAAGGVGGTIGTLASSPIARRLSILHSIRVSALCRAFLLAGIPLSALDKSLGFEVLLAVRFALGFAWSVFAVSQLSARQTSVRPGMLSNVTAINKFLTRGVGPIGSLAGGLLAAQLGVTDALVIGAIVGAIGGLLVLLPARPQSHPAT
jgi:predicted MFS family arabinose efflux permease